MFSELEIKNFIKVRRAENHFKLSWRGLKLEEFRTRVLRTKDIKHRSKLNTRLESVRLANNNLRRVIKKEKANE